MELVSRVEQLQSYDTVKLVYDAFKKLEEDKIKTSNIIHTYIRRYGIGIIF